MGLAGQQDAGDAVAQVQQLAGIVSGLVQPGAEVVEEERIEHLEDVRHAGVVHAQGSPFLIITTCPVPDTFSTFSSFYSSGGGD